MPTGPACEKAGVGGTCSGKGPGRPRWDTLSDKAKGRPGEAEMTLPRPRRAWGQFGLSQGAGEYQAAVTCPDLWVLSGPLATYGDGRG